MQRVKTKKKKPPEHREAKDPYTFIELTNYLLMAVFIRTMATVYGWNEEQMGELIEAVMALLEEVGDRRGTVRGMIKDTKELTGYDVKEIFKTRGHLRK